MDQKNKFEYHHIVGFEETNFLGNVYYVNHLRWQGRCRELFLQKHAPEVLEELNGDLRMVTTKCSCEYFLELSALEEVVVKMSLGSIRQNRILMIFEYLRENGKEGQLVAKGEQEIACMRSEIDPSTGQSHMVPSDIPDALKNALKIY